MTIFKKTGANTIYNLFGISALILLALLISFLLPKNILIPMSVIGLYISFYIIYKIFKTPRVGVIIIFFISFFAIGSARLLPDGIPVGLSMDFVLALTWIIIFFKGFKSADW